MDERHAQLEGVDRPVPDGGATGGSLTVVLGVEIREEHDPRIGGEEDEHVPSAMKVGKPQAGPCVAKQPVVDPAGDGEDPQRDRPAPQASHAEGPLAAQVMAEQDHRRHAQGHQEEGVQRGRQEAEQGTHTREDQHLQCMFVAP